ncbi:MAG: NADPH-dependent F420 reductase [Chloroflexi bacterium]|nr:NADPH-dependent F420 reductase [Chloroflexota bacterium]MDA1145515.1 NADPH-dependent F420 reductase [Chloroflexota bacterium]
MTHRIALVGGTGPEGRGLATRFAKAGHTVVLGSRDAARGAEVAAELAASLAVSAPSATTVTGSDNETAVADADVVVVVVPYSAHRPTLEGLGSALDGKIVVDAVVPVQFDRGPRPIEVAAGSATEEAKQILPEARVIGAFHNLSAEVLLEPDAPLHADVLVTGGDQEAKALVMALANEIEGARAVDAGPLRFSRFVEGITILLIGINGRYKTHSGIQVAGLDGEASS